jgi:hypothetical protein
MGSTSRKKGGAAEPAPQHRVALGADEVAQREHAIVELLAEKDDVIELAARAMKTARERAKELEGRISLLRREVKERVTWIAAQLPLPTAGASAIAPAESEPDEYAAPADPPRAEPAAEARPEPDAPRGWRVAVREDGSDEWQLSGPAKSEAGGRKSFAQAKKLLYPGETARLLGPDGEVLAEATKPIEREEPAADAPAPTKRSNKKAPADSHHSVWLCRDRSSGILERVAVGGKTEMEARYRELEAGLQPGQRVELVVPRGHMLVCAEKPDALWRIEGKRAGESAWEELGVSSYRDDARDLYDHARDGSEPGDAVRLLSPEGAIEVEAVKEGEAKRDPAEVYRELLERAERATPETALNVRNEITAELKAGMLDEREAGELVAVLDAATRPEEREPEPGWRIDHRVATADPWQRVWTGTEDNVLARWRAEEFPRDGAPGYVRLVDYAGTQRAERRYWLTEGKVRSEANCAHEKQPASLIRARAARASSVAGLDAVATELGIALAGGDVVNAEVLAIGLVIEQGRTELAEQAEKAARKGAGPGSAAQGEATPRDPSAPPVRLALKRSAWQLHRRGLLDGKGLPYNGRWRDEGPDRVLTAPDSLALDRVRGYIREHGLELRGEGAPALPEAFDATPDDDACDELVRASTKNAHVVLYRPAAGGAAAWKVAHDGTTASGASSALKSCEKKLTTAGGGAVRRYAQGTLAESFLVVGKAKGASKKATPAAGQVAL